MSRTERSTALGGWRHILGPGLANLIQTAPRAVVWALVVYMILAPVRDAAVRWIEARAAVWELVRDEPSREALRVLFRPETSEP